MYQLVVCLICAIIICSSTVKTNDFENAQKIGLGYMKISHLVKVFSVQRDRLEPLRRQASTERRLDIYCYEGESIKRLSRLWTSVQFKLAIVGDSFEIFTGKNETEAYQNYKQVTQSLWSWLMRRSGTDSIALSPFNKSCVAIETKEQYAVMFRVKAIDALYLLYIIVGLTLFFGAKRLCRNVLFYYSTGITIGIVASTLVLVFIMSRFVPFKKGAYVVMFGGWSITLWAWRFLWENFQPLIETYYTYVVGYMLTAAMGSFLYCYYKGPVSNPRTLDILQWIIQFFGLIFVYNGSQIPEISLAMVIALISIAFVPWRFFRYFSLAGFPLVKYWRRRFPRKQRLLTEEEYFAQASEETRKALAELKEHCRSPECDAWKTISRLQSPNRFASWVEGDSHFTDTELSLYEHDPMTLQYSDLDESDIEFQLNSL